MANRRLPRRIPFRKRVRYGSYNINSSDYTLNISKNGAGKYGNKVHDPGQRNRPNFINKRQTDTNAIKSYKTH